jgi:hypothetical protein
MGLDQYAYKVKKGYISEPVDFSFNKYDKLTGKTTDIIPESEYEQIAYWRKHYDLQAWMHILYNQKGGKSQEFNCDKLLLSEEDLNNLEELVIRNDLPLSSDVFQRENYLKETTLKFIADARDAIKEDFQIVYDSWW